MTRKIALLATVLAIASVPTAALAVVVSTLPPGPVSFSTTCEASDRILFTVGQTQTFDLTDVTIANFTGSTQAVVITNTFIGGAEYVVGPGSNVTQKFETPIRFKGTSNSPELECTSLTEGIGVSIQGLMH